MVNNGGGLTRAVFRCLDLHKPISHTTPEGAAVHAAFCAYLAALGAHALEAGNLKDALLFTWGEVCEASAMENGDHDWRLWGRAALNRAYADMIADGAERDVDLERVIGHDAWQWMHRQLDGLSEQ